MANKYPSATARSRNVGKPANFPRAVPRPANDNRMGSLILGKAPLRLARPVEPLIRAYNATAPFYEAMRETQRLSVGVPSLQRINSDAYWQFTCRGGGSQWRVGNSSFTCGMIFQKDQTIVVSGWSPTFPTSTSLSYLGIAQDIGDYAPSPDPNVRRFEVTTRATRRAGAPIPTPVNQSVPVMGTSAAPMPWPLSFPTASPVAVPVPKPRPEPERRPEPRRRPDPRKRPGQRPPPRKRPSTPPRPQPRPVGDPFRAPSTKPGAVPAPKPTTPGQPGRGRPRTRPRPREVPSYPLPSPGVPIFIPPAFPTPVQPPGVVISNPGTRWRVDRTGYVSTKGPPRGLRTRGHKGGKAAKVEKKAKMMAQVAVAWAGINSFTEFMDFTRAMHNSIADPRKRLSDKASKQQVLDYMWTHPEAWRHIDFAAGLENFINMQIGDFVAALGSNQIKKVNQQMQSLTGLDGAIRRAGDYAQEVRDPNKEIFDAAPKLDIDAENGTVSVSGPGFEHVFRWKVRRFSDYYRRV